MVGFNLNNINSMNVSHCVTMCYRGGYRYAGLRDGNKCYCSDVYGLNGAVKFFLWAGGVGDDYSSSFLFWLC